MSTGYEQLDLLNLEQKTGRPPETRMRDVTAARGTFERLLQADEQSARNRARVQAMFDGAPPYNQALLNSTGQGSRCNLNFGEAERLHNTALSGFVDLESSVRSLVSVFTTLGGSSEKLRQDNVVSEEVTRAIREWPEFYPSYLRLCSEFIDHGVSVAYFPDETGWRFKTAGLAEFLVPRQTPAGEDFVEVAAALHHYRVDELYRFIENPDAAEKAGWDVAMVRAAIMSAAPKEAVAVHDWEAVEREIKNNDIYYSCRSSTVETVHMWVREIGGGISHFIFPRNAPANNRGKDGFLFKRLRRYENARQAFTFFTYGVGSNGTFHSIRGLGQRIFNHIQTSNRLRCQAVDAGMLAGSVMLQPNGQRALDELSLQYYGPYAVLSPNVEIVEKVAPNLVQSVIPVLQDMGQQLNDAVGFYSSRHGATGSPYRTRLQVQAELEAVTRLSSSSLHLFYASFTRLLREMVRRMVAAPGDPSVRELVRRIEGRGVSAQAFFTIDVEKTYANKAVGAGNPSQRAASLDRLEQRLAFLDPAGRQNAVFDLVASDIGYETAGRYAAPADEPREAPEQKTAMLENAHLGSGQPIQVLQIENHSIHIAEHFKPFGELLQAVDTGAADPAQVIGALRAFYDHVAAHAQAIAADPTQQRYVGQVQDELNKANQIITNMERKAMAEQREGGGEGQQGPNLDEERARTEQLKRQIELEKLDMARQSQAVDQQIKLSKEARERAKTDVELSVMLRGGDRYSA